MLGIPFFDRLADETLQYILNFAMVRESPFHIDNLAAVPPLTGVEYGVIRPYIDYEGTVKPPPVLESATGIKIPFYANPNPEGKVLVHDYMPQSVHRADWIIINSTNRTIIVLGSSYFSGLR